MLRMNLDNGIYITDIKTVKACSGGVSNNKLWY